MKTKTIEIDLDVYKAIESRRQTFDESENDILRRDYLRNSVIAVPGEAARPTADRSKLTRKSGDYDAMWKSGAVTANSLKALLKATILELARTRPALVENISKHRTSRGRRIVARKPEELYPGNPQLIDKCAAQLDSRWWYDTNVSTGQCQSYLNVIGAIAEVGDIQIAKRG